MNIEDKIQNMFSNDETSLDAENFLDDLHSTRKKIALRTRRITYGVSSIAIVLLVGILSISQLNNATDNQISQIDTDEEYYEDLMVYLVDESDDIWDVVEFYDEITNE